MNTKKTAKNSNF